ncbi:urease subunit gamma, partial [Streptomyces virginiae]|uniref:urease subunit gamma n=1 Tax=Streptomyces virginiae TaxID=1961 RepID=UPI00345DD493
VLPGVADIVTEVMVEAVFEDGSRLAAVGDPFGAHSRYDGAPGAVLPGSDTVEALAPALVLSVRNTADV